MFVLVTVLLDVPRWVIESGIVGAEGNGTGNGCLSERVYLLDKAHGEGCSRPESLLSLSMFCIVKQCNCCHLPSPRGHHI